jgi:uncharacterized membrane protein (UPF0127 family)
LKHKYIALFLFTAIGVSLLLLYGSLLLRGANDEFLISAKNPGSVADKSSPYRLANITINGFNLLADVPTTNDEFQKGLDIKDHLDENRGMLFIFKKPVKEPFWMHGMKFPIDIIWLDKGGNVVHIERNLSPCLTDLACPTYSPETDSLYVLETTANFTERHGVDIGTHMNYHLIK